MQTKKVKMKNTKTTPPPCIDKPLLFKMRELKEGDGERNRTNSPGYVLGAPKLCDPIRIGSHGTSATRSYVKAHAFHSDAIKARRSLSNSSATGFQTSL